MRERGQETLAYARDLEKWAASKTEEFNARERALKAHEREFGVREARHHAGMANAYHVSLNSQSAFNTWKEKSH